MTRADGERIRRAIDAAEHGTTGRIGVRIVHGKTEDALADARNHFVRAHLHEHKYRNAVVFFVAPRARRFAVVGDEAIHEQVGEGFWMTLVDEMAPHFARGDLAQGLLLGIARVGEQFKMHFSEHVPV